MGCAKTKPVLDRRAEMWVRDLMGMLTRQVFRDGKVGEKKSAFERDSEPGSMLGL